MRIETDWAEYARIQASAKLATSISHSDASDVRLSHIINDVTGCTADIERAVRSNARKKRSQQLARKLTGHAFMPNDMPTPEQALIWKQSWERFGEALEEPDRNLLVRDEMTTARVPMTGAERTRLSRVRSSAAYKSVQYQIFVQ